MMKYIFLGNLLGLPGISVPVGYDASTKLPIGMHLRLGREHQRTGCLRVVNAAEAPQGPKRAQETHDSSRMGGVWGNSYN